jgi:hypothetical protein
MEERRGEESASEKMAKLRELNSVTAAATELGMYVEQEVGEYLRKYGNDLERNRTSILGFTKKDRQSVGTRFFGREHKDPDVARDIRGIMRELFNFKPDPKDKSGRMGKFGLDDASVVSAFRTDPQLFNKLMGLYEQVVKLKEMKFNHLEALMRKFIFAVFPNIRACAEAVAKEITQAAVKSPFEDVRIGKDEYNERKKELSALHHLPEDQVEALYRSNGTLGKRSEMKEFIAAATKNETLKLSNT